MYLTDPAHNRVLVREFAGASMLAGRPGQPPPRATRTSSVAVGQTPVAIVSDTVRHQVVVANRDSKTLTVFDGRTGTVVATVPLAGQPTALSIDLVGQRVLVAIGAGRADNAVVVLDARNYAVQHRVAIAAPATALHLTRSHDQVLVSYGASPAPSIVDVTTGAAVSSPATPQFTRSAAVDAGPGLTFVVDSPVDAVDANPGDGQCRTANGTCTLRAAVQEANAHPGADTIQLAAGTYTLAIANVGTADEDLAATGDLDVADNLTIRGAGSDQTTIDSGVLDRVLEVIGAINVSVSGLTLHSIVESTDPDLQLVLPGGAVLNSAGQLYFSDVSIAGGGSIMGSVIANLGQGRFRMTGGSVLNDASPTFGDVASGLDNAGEMILDHVTITGSSPVGRGIWNEPGGSLTITGSAIHGSADFTRGGGINNQGVMQLSGGTLSGSVGGCPSPCGEGGALDNSGTATLTDVAISGYAGTGGAIHSSGQLDLRHVSVTGEAAGGGAIAGSFILIDSTITDSRATDVGGFGGAIASAGTVKIVHSIITNNRAVGTDGSASFGGAIAGSDTLEIVDSTISDNEVEATGESTGAGGAIAFGGHLKISNSTLSGNVGTTVDGGGRGGAIAGSGALEIVNSTLSGNRASGDFPFGGHGGAIAFDGPVSIVNSTIADNVAFGQGPEPTGAGLDGPATLQNTILAHNRLEHGDVAREVNCQVPVNSLGHNLSTDRSCGLSGPGDQENAEPRLGPLADNGGATQTRALLPGSPAIDAGTNTGCPSTDQRGVPRPLDGSRDGVAVCDIGAFEVQPPADARAPVTTATLNPLPNAAGWERADTTVTFAAQDEPGGSGVKAITFSAAGADPIPSTTIAGSTASVPLVAEGVTTLTFFATDRAGNQELSRTLSVKLDKTAPEAMLRFDTTTNDVLVFGRDALSGVDPAPIPPTTRSDVSSASLSTPAPLDPELLSLPQLQDVRGLVQSRLAAESATSSKQLRTYVIHDQAGNPTTLVLDVRQTGGTLAVDVRSVRYANGPVLPAPTNRSRFVWPPLTAPTNRTGSGTAAPPDALAATQAFLLQHMQVGQGTASLSALAVYRNTANETMLVLSDAPAGQRVTRQPGLVLLQLATHTGQLAIEH